MDHGGDSPLFEAPNQYTITVQGKDCYTAVYLDSGTLLQDPVRRQLHDEVKGVPPIEWVHADDDCLTTVAAA